MGRFNRKFPEKKKTKIKTQESIEEKMPNWCSNNLTVSGPNAKLFYEENGGDTFSLKHAVPSNDHCKDWGTKWDVDLGDAYCDDEECVYSFHTAWSPPISWVVRASQMYPRLEFSLEYEESGCDLRGSTTIQNGITLHAEEGDFYREATEEDAKEAIGMLGLGPCASSDLVEEYVDERENDLDNLAWGDLEGNVTVDSLCRVVKKQLFDDVKRRGRERLRELFYAVCVLKKFVRSYVEYVNAPGGAVYEKTRARFEQMAAEIGRDDDE